jgi:hypothetical protein
MKKMIQFDDIKIFFHHVRNIKFDMIPPVITTLISGLITIDSGNLKGGKDHGTN